MKWIAFQLRAQRAAVAGGFARKTAAQIPSYPPLESFRAIFMSIRKLLEQVLLLFRQRRENLNL